jgi:hypothetical protein
MPVDDALDILRREADKGFWEARIVTAFADLVRDGLLKGRPQA